MGWNVGVLEMYNKGRYKYYAVGEFLDEELVWVCRRCGAIQQADESILFTDQFIPLDCKICKVKTPHYLATRPKQHEH